MIMDEPILAAENEIKEAKTSDNSRKILPSVLVCFFASFSLFIFAPLDIYFANIDSFIFSVSDVITGMLVPFGAVFLILFLACMLLRLKTPRMYKAFLALITGLSAAAYIQGNFLSINDSTLEGSSIDWRMMRYQTLFNGAIWIAIILIPFLIAFFIKPFKRKFFSFASILSIGLSLVLMSTLVTLFINMPQSDAAKYYMSPEKTKELSTKENIIVLMVDTVDVKYFDEILEKNPDKLTGLDGFTYYHNMGGSYIKTAGSVMYWLTGQYYLNQEPFMRYCQRSFAEDMMFPELKSMDYDIRIHESGLMTQYIEKQKQYISNLKSARVDIPSYADFNKQMLLFTAYRYAPIMMKPFFFDDFNTKLSDIAVLGENNEAIVNDDVMFYNHLKSDPLTTQDNSKAFRFYMLNGAHRPISMNEHSERVPVDSVTQYEQTLGTFNYLDEYLSQMKELGIYDNSTIIIAADHGDGWATSPIFLIKEKNGRGELKINQAPVSHEDFRATIMQAAGGDFAKYGKPVNAWNAGDKRDRKLYCYSHTSISNFDLYFGPIYEYNVPENAGNYDEYKKSGQVFEPQ